MDGLFLKYNKPICAIEVKWKKNISEKDIRKAEQNLSKAGVTENILFVPDKKGIKTGLKLMDPHDLI